MSNKSSDIKLLAARAEPTATRRARPPGPAAHRAAPCQPDVQPSIIVWPPGLQTPGGTVRWHCQCARAAGAAPGVRRPSRAVGPLKRSLTDRTAMIGQCDWTLEFRSLSLAGVLLVWLGNWVGYWGHLYKRGTHVNKGG